MVSVLPGRPSVSYYPYAYFEEWRARTRSLSGTFAEADVDTNLTEDGGSRLVRTGIVSADYFTTLGATPAMGRLLGAGDEWAAQGELPAVLSYDFWHTRFHGDAAALGSVLRLNGQPFVVVGVLPRRVNGTAVESGPSVWVPLVAGKYLGLGADPKQCCQWGIGGRLRPGVTLHQAEAETVAALHAAMMAAESRNKPLTEDARKADRTERRPPGIDRARRLDAPHALWHGTACPLRRRGAAPAAGMRQHRGTAAGAGRRARTGDGRTRGLGRDTRPPDAALAGRKRPAGGRGRPGGIAAGESGLGTGARSASGGTRSRHVAGAGVAGCHARRTRLRIYTGRLFGGRPPRRTWSGMARIPRQPHRLPEIELA